MKNFTQFPHYFASYKKYLNKNTYTHTYMHITFMHFACSVILHAFLYDPRQMTMRTMFPRYFTP